LDTDLIGIYADDDQEQRNNEKARKIELSGNLKVADGARDHKVDAIPEILKEF